MSSQAKLYESRGSFHSAIVRQALYEQGVTWDSHKLNLFPMMENYKPWYMQIHPGGVVPALAYRGQIVTETGRILRYIVQHMGPLHQRQIPQSPRKNDEMEAWMMRLESFPMRELSAGLLLQGGWGRLVELGFAMRRKAIKWYMRCHPELAGWYESKLEDLNMWQEKASDPQRVLALEVQAQRIISDLEHAITGPWLMDDQFTLADIWLSSILTWLHKRKCQRWWKPTERPRVHAYFKRLQTRPSYFQAHRRSASRKIYHHTFRGSTMGSFSRP